MAYRWTDKYMRKLADSRPEACRGCPQGTPDGFCRLRNRMIRGEGDVPAACRIGGGEGRWPESWS